MTEWVSTHAHIWGGSVQGTLCCRAPICPLPENYSLPTVQGGWDYFTVLLLVTAAFHVNPDGLPTSFFFFFLLHTTIQFSSVQLLSCVWLFVTPWTAARQASLSITNSQSLFKLMSITSVMPFNDLIPCCPLLLLHLQSFPASGSFPVTQLFTSGGQSIGVSASVSVLPVNTQDWSPLGLTGWISLQSKGLSRVFSTPQFKSINSSVLSFLYSPTLTSIHDYWKNHSFD